MDINSMANTVQSVWKIPPNLANALERNISDKNRRHGLIGPIPIICRGKSATTDRVCPYVETCPLTHQEIQDNINSYCVPEISLIINQFDKYCEYFGVEDKDVVDLGQIKQLVDIEVQLMRCNKKVAVEGDFVYDVITAVDKGVKFTEKKLTPVSDYMLKLQTRHSQILKDLSATRNAKKQDAIVDASATAAELIQRTKEMVGGAGTLQMLRSHLSQGTPMNVVKDGYLTVETEPVSVLDEE